MRWIKVIGGLTALMLLMSGCIRYEADIVIDDDGSGSVRLLTALNTEAFGEEASLFPTEELCSEFASDTGDIDGLPPGAVISDYEDDGFCGSEITFDLQPSTDHSATLANAFDDDGGTRLFKQGDNWIFETGLDTDEVTNDSDGLISDDEFNELLGDATVRFTVDLPGRAIDGQNNATTVGSDGRFEWDIDLLNPPARLFAQTEPGSGGGDGGGGLGMILIILALVLLAAAAAWWFLTQRNKGGGSTTPPLGAAPPLGSPAASPQAAAPPVATTPPAQAPGASTSSPVMPSNPSAHETIAINPAEAQAAAAQARAEAEATAAQGAGSAAAGATSATEPVWDANLNAWVIDDPVQGRLVHDSASNTWKPA